MNLSLGIVGLPNVGKSTLFNTLTNTAVPAENYPFTTINPNIGVVAVPDERIQTIVDLVKPDSTVYPVVEFVDIAGLVKGAHEGQGLGNQFLTNIRNVTAIVHVIRAFEDSSIIHVENRIDPKDDREIIETELILKDLEGMDKRIDKASEEVRRDKANQKFLDLVKGIKEVLNQGKTAIQYESDKKDIDLQKFREELFLLTDKPMIYLINTNENSTTQEDIAKWRKQLEIPEQFPIIPLNIKQEFEISTLKPEERQEFISELGIDYKGLPALILESYNLLGLMTYFTAGVQEVRGWTIYKGYTAPQAAGVIHTDFERKFIAAEVTSYEDFIACGGWSKVKEMGKMRLEGKAYVVKDGDVMLFRHGA